MSEVLPAWSAYARLQEKLARTRQINDHAWGLEAALSWLLTHLGHLRSEEDAARALRSGSRKERHRARLRRLHLSPTSVTGGPEQAVHAGLELQAAEAAVTDRDWALLLAIAEGHSYQELAAHAKIPAGALRVRALRLRRSILSKIPDWRERQRQ